MPQLSCVIGMSQQGFQIWSRQEMGKLICLGGMIRKPFRYEISSRWFSDFYHVKFKCNSLGRACMSHLINRKFICYKRGHIEYILEVTMLNFNRTSPNSWDLRVISHINSRSSWEIQSGEGFPKGNHVVGCSIIYQMSLRLSEACLQGMAPLMIFCRLSNIRILCSLWKGNIFLFKEC